MKRFLYAHCATVWRDVGALTLSSAPQVCSPNSRRSRHIAARASARLRRRSGASSSHCGMTGSSRELGGPEFSQLRRGGGCAVLPVEAGIAAPHRNLAAVTALDVAEE